MKKHLLPFLMLISFSLNAQIIISEFSAANFGGFNSNVGDNEDWVELQNTGTTDLDVGGYFLSDKLTNPDKWEIPAGTIIPANEYLHIWVSGEDAMIGTELHAGFKITQTRNSESIVLSNPSGTVIDLNEIDIPNQANHSYARDENGVWKICNNPTPGTANNSLFEGYELTPEMSPDAGFYNSSVTVTITAPNPNATIYYTTDGSRPSNNSNTYSGSLTITSTSVLRAVAYSPNGNILPSFFETNTYFIDEVHTIPVISVSGGIEVNELIEGNEFARPMGYLELFKNGIVVDEAQGEYNKHGNDSWDYEQRGIDWITRDQTGYDDDISGDPFEIFEAKDRTDFQRLIFKAAANDNYPFIQGAHIRDAYVHTLSHLADMEMDERTSEFCILYVNGEYWGVYDMREKVDDNDFTKYYYGQGRQYLDFIKTWGATWEEYGSKDDWDDLHDFVFYNDMSDDANYAIVEQQFELISLIDYVLLHAHIVSQDWLNWNTAWWRGRNPDGGAQKWRYILWDEDATFGHYFNYTGIPDVTANADPCNVETIDTITDNQGHIYMFTKLYENEQFKTLYINRYADMNNSFFSCDFMNNLLDSMVNVIAPEMQRQTDRWGGSVAEWQNNVQELRDFINTRCTVIDVGITDCYDVTGPYNLTVNIEPPNSPNEVEVNTFVPVLFPFSGDYFGGIDLTLTAKPAGDWMFDHWEVANHMFGPDQYAEAISMSIDSADVVTAFFNPGIPCGAPSSPSIEVSMFGANLEWNGPLNTISYEVRYRAVGSTDWISISTADLEYILGGLESCTDYELEIRSICEVALSSYFVTTFTTECATNTSELEGSKINNINVFPNPFKDQLSVKFDLANNENITLEIITLHGQLIKQLPKGELIQGEHLITIPFDSDLSNGMYLLRVVTDNGAVVRRVMKTNPY